MKKLLLLLGVLLFAAPAVSWAQDIYDYEWFSPKRLTIGARFERLWYDEILRRDFKTEYAGGLVAAWVIVPRLSVTGRYMHAIDSEEDSFALGLSLKLFDGYRDLR